MSEPTRFERFLERWERKARKPSDPILWFARGGVGLYLMIHALITPGNQAWMYGLGMLLCWSWSVERDQRDRDRDYAQRVAEYDQRVADWEAENTPTVIVNQHFPKTPDE